MGLQSKLFRGDPRLEAAAVSDPAHIMLGASGPHVQKIQTALMILDGASISADEVQRAFYGASTATAVLAYKQKRNIINRSYQTQADNIVGKMTMASLDGEMLKREITPPAPVRIKPLSFWRVRPPRSPAVLALLGASRPLAFNAAPRFGALGAPHILPGPTTVLEIPRHGDGHFLVENGFPGKVMIDDPSLALLQLEPDPLFPVPFPPPPAAIVQVPAPSGIIPGVDISRYKVIGGKELGRTTVDAISDFGSRDSIDVVVRIFKPSPPPFIEGDRHDHEPCRKWPAIQAHPNSGEDETRACKFFGPEGVVQAAKLVKFLGKPIALKHLDWYLSDGKGADFNEDGNILDWLLHDGGIKRRLKHEIFIGGGKLNRRGHFEFSQDEYDIQDFRFAFGGIDWLDFEVDLSDDTVRVWFKDRYEWHPFYPGLYTVKSGKFGKSGDDVVRETNCVHAALVELKDKGAADFWMIGEAVVPLSLIAKP